MGVVWAAVNELTSREVAIKLIVKSTPDLRHRLLREAKACGSLSHRNIIEVLDVGQDENGDPFLVMPLLQGETLKDLLDRQFRLDVPIAAQVARDVARALAAAHAATIVHRDLKPANIFLHQEPGTEGLVVKVLDFGVSKNLSAQEAMATVAGGLLGSPAYMSPEQIKAVRDIDPRSDVWSLGVVLFEMLSGRRPFQGEPQEVIAKILRGEIPRIAKFVRNIDPTLDALVANCLQMDRDRRMSSAAELAKLLNGYTGSNETSRIFAEAPQRGSSPSVTDALVTRHTAQPSSQDHSPAVPPSVHVTPPSRAMEVGASTERIHPEVLASLARRPSSAASPVPAPTPTSDPPLSNAGFAGTTMPLGNRADIAPRDVRKTGAPEPSSEGAPPMAVTEKLDPARFAELSRMPRTSPKGTMIIDDRPSATPLPSDGGDASRGSSPPDLARGGTVKIPLDSLPKHSPLPAPPPPPQTGATTSTAPLMRSAKSGPPGRGNAPVFGGILGQGDSEAALSGVSPRTKTAIVIGAAALVLTIVGIGAYSLVSSPAAPAASAEPIAAPTPSPSPSIAPSAESAPPAMPSALASTEASAPSGANPQASGKPAQPSTSASAAIPPSTSGGLGATAAGPQPSAKRLVEDPYGPTPRCGKLIKKDCPPTKPRHNPGQL
jgi:serine/threonine-protein kinase